MTGRKLAPAWAREVEPEEAPDGRPGEWSRLAEYDDTVARSRRALAEVPRALGVECDWRCTADEEEGDADEEAGYRAHRHPVHAVRKDPHMTRLVTPLPGQLRVPLFLPCSVPPLQ